MSLTPYHARYFAMLLTRRTHGVERYFPALSSANIDIHPHQIDAAVFATRSPFLDGVILADEEGLGKTIEAGIALLQASLEGRRNLLVLCPPNLLAHWRDELDIKFSLPAITPDNHDSQDGAILMSYQQAARRSEWLASVAWDLCVLDEAHLLANAGLSAHIQSDSIRNALRGRSKLLLTATPMQNSLLDLYYLVRFVDDTTFTGDPEAFRARYMAKLKHKQELAERAQLLCQRTLRRQAITMPLTRRYVRTLLVTASPEEDELSKRLSLYFHREHLAAFPRVQEHRIRLTYWKMLASSPHTLRVSLERLAARLDNIPNAREERHELQAIAHQAAAIGAGSRAEALLQTLPEAMHRMAEMGAPEKAVIFSEYHDTLRMLHELLSNHGYRDQIVFNPKGRIRKTALREFARSGKILLATDSVGMGLDLTHCALVVNYDLPWNVQKLEQRISRCHRYGQKHDVHVLNFIDPGNRADRRLYDSLNKKLKQFDAVFGASETILGVVGDSQRSDASQSHETPTEPPSHIVEERVTAAEADLLAYFDDAVRERFRRYADDIPTKLSRLDYWLWEITRYRLANRAVFMPEERRFVLEKSPYYGLRLSRVTFGMDRSLPRGERYHLGHPLARRVLADCLEGILDSGDLTLAANGDFASGMAGELGLWLIGMASDVSYVTEPLLCGVTADGKPLSHDVCAGILKLDVVDCRGGLKWDAGENETYRGRAWRGAIPEDDTRHTLRNNALDALRDQTLESARQRLAMQHDETLQAELTRLRQWAEDEETALKERQEELRRRIADAKSRSEQTPAYVQRFRANQQTAALEKERRRAEAGLAQLAAEIRCKRDGYIEEAKRKAKCRFWDEEMFVVKFKVVDNT